MNRAGSAAGLLPQSWNAGSRKLTRTERNWLRTAAIVVGSVLFFAVIYQVEMNMGRWKNSLRLVLHPMETTMRYLSLSHIFVAAVYMFTSRRMRTGRAWLQAAAMIAVSVPLCVGYARLEIASLWIADIAFFAFFLIHDYRDQIFFYQFHGDAPEVREPKALARALFLLPFLLLAALFCVAAPAIALGALSVARVSETAAALSPPARWAAALLPTVIFAAALSILWRKFQRADLGSFRSFLGANRPILFVFAGGILLTAFGEITTGLPNAIVLLHFVSWYVFTDRLLRTRTPAPAPSPAMRRFSWAAIRNTTGGFRLIHLGSAVLLVGLGIAWAYGFSNDPAVTPFRLLLAPENFRYWTILHVTVSFAGR